MGRKANEITGKKYGNLTVIKKSHYDGKSLFWECRCNCGETCLVKYTDLNRGRINFCKKCNEQKSKNTVIRLFFENYKRNAINRKYVFELTIDEFSSIIKKPCNYCKTEPKQVFYKQGLAEKLIYNGIDRQNNAEGYIMSNCVPACKFCNLAKSKFLLTEFLEWLARLKNTNNGITNTTSL